jgi:hypothetical protein
MDDDTLAPFVDALASALIMMVLVSIFFLIQTATSLRTSAQLSTINDKEVNEGKPLFSPIVYRDVVSFDLDNNSFRYIVNFKLEGEPLTQIQSQLMEASQVVITVESNDVKRKSLVNVLAFLEAVDLPSEIKVRTRIEPAESALSQLSWEIIE